MLSEIESIVASFQADSPASDVEFHQSLALQEITHVIDSHKPSLRVVAETVARCCVLFHPATLATGTTLPSQSPVPSQVSIPFLLSLARLGYLAPFNAADAGRRAAAVVTILDEWVNTLGDGKAVKDGHGHSWALGWCVALLAHYLVDGTVTDLNILETVWIAINTVGQTVPAACTCRLLCLHALEGLVRVFPTRAGLDGDILRMGHRVVFGAFAGCGSLAEHNFCRHSALLVMEGSLRNADSIDLIGLSRHEMVTLLQRLVQQVNLESIVDDPVAVETNFVVLECLGTQVGLACVLESGELAFRVLGLVKQVLTEFSDCYQGMARLQWQCKLLLGKLVFFKWQILPRETRDKMK
ncbi:hypothetical protein HDU98_002074, partial [Podochytrium sp. JEL0797]